MKYRINVLNRVTEKVLDVNQVFSDHSDAVARATDLMDDDVVVVIGSNSYALNGILFNFTWINGRDVSGQ